MKTSMMAKPKAPKKPYFWMCRPIKPTKKSIGVYETVNIPNFDTVSGLTKWFKQFDGKETKIIRCGWDSIDYIEVYSNNVVIEKKLKNALKQYKKSLANYQRKKMEFVLKLKQYNNEELPLYKKQLAMWNLQQAKVEWNKLVRKKRST